MKKHRYRKQAPDAPSVQTLAGAPAKPKAPRKPLYSIAPKSISQARKDIADWTSAVNMAKMVDSPKRFPLYNLYDQVLLDALLTSQIENRRNKSLSAVFTIYGQDGKPKGDLTEALQNKPFVGDLNRHLLDARYFGHSLVQFSVENDYRVTLIPRQNVIPEGGYIVPDYTQDTTKVDYRHAKEYGSWVLEFGAPGDLGLLNQATPHVLFKKFAQSCWSELCEIYGIPPRVLKTNTADAQMLHRAEAMMRDMGAAAWYIIDQNEAMEWAQGLNTSGDVYKNLINLCNNELSLLISGAVIGQDTQNGARAKDQSAREVLADLVTADMSLVEQYWNSAILPALVQIGAIPPGDYRFAYDKTEDLQQLWTMTKELLPYKNVDNRWINDKFGIPVTGERNSAGENLNLGADLFFDV